MRPDTHPAARGRIPRFLAPCAAVLCIGLALTQAISEETPVGRVRGRTLIAETGKPLGGAEVTLSPITTEGEEKVSRRARTGEDGRFALAQVPAGAYRVSASARAHAVRDTYLTVDEGGTSEATLGLARSEPELALSQHQRIFGTDEPVKLPVRGYVDGAEVSKAGGDTVRVRMYKARLSDLVQNGGYALLAAITRGPQGADGQAASGALPPAAIQARGSYQPAKVLDRKQPITEADREGFYFQRLDFGALRPGLYLTQIDHAKASASTWVLVTDMALVVKRARQQLVAYTVDMKRGTPLAGTQVRTYRGGAVVGSGVTDGSGLCAQTVPAPSGGEEDSGDDGAVTIAARGDDEALVQRDEYGSEEDKGQYAVAAYTDRPLYRPGQRVYFKGIARRALDPGAKYAVPSGQPVEIEVRDEQNDTVYKDRAATNAYGSFVGRFDLSPEAPTGTYTMTMRLAGEEHTAEITVASYKKPEYEVTVTPAKKTYLPGESVEMTVSAQYYFGAPVAGAEVTYYVDRQPDWAADYPDDDYDPEDDRPDQLWNADAEYRGETNGEGKVRLDENGKAVIRIPAEGPKGPDSPQQQTYTVSATVKDDAQREVTADGQASVAAGQYRLWVQPDGYVAQPGAASSMVVLVRDLSGAPVPNLRVGVQAGYASWKDGDYRFKPFGDQFVTTGPDGRAVAQVTPPRAGELRINAQVSDPGGRKVRAHTELWAAGDGSADLDTTYADLSLLTDRRRYKPGDTARVLINAARTGQSVLLTVEGQRVYRTFLVPMKQRSTVAYVPVLPEYGPNVTLAACYISDKKFAQSEAPLRVAVAQRALRVTVVPDRQETGDRRQETRSQRPDDPMTQRPNALPRYSPRDTVTYTVTTTDAAGRPVPAEFSFGVVDESIYALREDNPTVLRDAFYPHRYNHVRTSYSFEIVYLGDADKTEPKIEARKRFPDTVFWEPALRTSASGRATVRVPLADNLTTWRATAVAQTTDSAFGRETTKVLAAKDFFVRVETPRFLTSRDRSRIVALVHNDTGAPQTALVHLRVDGITVDGAPSQSLQIPAGGVGQLAWPCTALDAEKARVDVSAWTPKAAPPAQAPRPPIMGEAEPAPPAPNNGGANGGPAEYTDRVETSIPIRPHGREEVTAVAGQVTEGETPETFRLDPTARRAELTVRITPSVAGSLAGALDYLVGYPWGCTEQTMSRFLPDVMVQRLSRMSGLKLRAAQAAELPKMVRDGLTRLRRFQHSSGAWGWWQTDADDPWMTAYVLYGLAQARDAGYPVPKELLKKGREGGVGLLATVRDDSDKAFLLYALSLVSTGDDLNTARIVRHNLRLTTLSPAALAYVALLDRRLGDSPSAAMTALGEKAQSEAGGLCWKSKAETGTGHGWDDRMTTAAGLRALVAADRNDRRIPDVLRWLMQTRTGDYWLDTRDTAWVLGALCDYLTAFPLSASPSGEVTVKVNGTALPAVGLTPDTTTREVVLRVPPSLLRPGKNDVLIGRAGGSSTVFYSVELRQTLSTEDMAAYSPSRITVKREYLRRVPRKAGTDSWQLQTEPTGGKLNQGDRVLVRLTIEAPADMSYVLIEDPFPSGCEVTERGMEDEVVEWGYWWSSVDIRDDRIAFFARTLHKGKNVLEYNLRAQTPGQFHTLPTLVQAMYAPDQRAYSAEARVEIR